MKKPLRKLVFKREITDSNNPIWAIQVIRNNSIYEYLGGVIYSALRDFYKLFIIKSIIFITYAGVIKQGTLFQNSNKWYCKALQNKILMMENFKRNTKTFVKECFTLDVDNGSAESCYFTRHFINIHNFIWVGVVNSCIFTSTTLAYSYPFTLKHLSSKRILSRQFIWFLI